MKKILSMLRKADKKYNLIENNDKIAIGVSGGKDSLVLLKAMANYRLFDDKKFDIIAITIDISSGKNDYTEISKLCDTLGVNYYVEKTDIQQVVFDIRKEKNPCSLCAKMRRGALNSVAKKHGCNKIALGHHIDDIVDTFFLSMLYEGRLSTMHPKSYMSNSKITLIRPLFLTNEKDIKSASKDLPILKSTCPANKNTQREYIKDLLKEIQKTIPFARDRIASSIVETERYNLLDK